MRLRKVWLEGIVVGLLLAPGLARAGEEVWRGVEPVAPASGEEFRATAMWAAVEPLAWEIATEVGMLDDERRLWMSVVWNESRGNPEVVGDFGCAVGLAQVHVGGVSSKGKRCADVRLKLPAELAQLPREAFFDPTINLLASATIFHAMRSWQGGRDPLLQLAWYAGCQGASLAPGSCSASLVAKHRHWWETGLRLRLLALEAIVG